MTILTDIWNASVNGRRKDLLAHRKEMSAYLQGAQPGGDYATTIEAWVRVLDAEIAAFEAAVKVEESAGNP